MRSQFQAELYLIMYQTVLYQYCMSLIFYKKSVLCISINFLVVDVIYMFTQCRMDCSFSSLEGCSVKNCYCSKTDMFYYACEATVVVLKICGCLCRIKSFHMY